MERQVIPMRARRVRLVVPVLAISLLLFPAAPGLALAGPASGQQQATAAEPDGAVTDLLKDLNESLRSENETLKTLNAILQAENEALKQENALLRSQLEAAQKRLQELEAATPGAATVEGVAARLRSSVFRIDVFDYAGRLIATGSGVAVGTRDVITNYHVVKEAWSAELVTESGDRIPVLGMTASDEAQDLALLLVQGSLEPVSLRSDPARTGEEVVAIGSPVGLTNTVSTGIVSGLRTIDGRDVIQVTAPISQGSSGGGLFDRQGRLIGITFALMEGGQNLNFAIPVKYVRTLVAQKGSLQDLPGVTRVTPENLVAVLQQSHPALYLGGYRVDLQYVLVQNRRALPGQAPAVLAIVMENDAFYNYLRGMVLTGSLSANQVAVEEFVLDVAAVVDQAYPGQDVTVLFLHMGQYSTYPSAFDFDEIDFDLDTGMWTVIHLELMVWESRGEWYSEWNI